MSLIKMKKKYKRYLAGTLLTIYKHFGDIIKGIFSFFFCKFITKIVFYLHVPVNTNKPKFVAVLVIACTTASFIAQISCSENVFKRDAILAPVAKQ